MTGQPVASVQLTPEQIEARVRGERLALWNDMRRRIEGAESLAELEAIEQQMTDLGLDADLRLNEQFERRWSRLGG